MCKDSYTTYFNRYYIGWVHPVVQQYLAEETAHNASASEEGGVCFVNPGVSRAVRLASNVWIED